MKKSRKTIVRAWTDPVFRATLSADERAALPVNPAGDELDRDLENVVGGITFGGGCGTAGCSVLICTDSCSNNCSNGCTDNVFCPKTSGPSDPDCQGGGSTSADTGIGCVPYYQDFYYY